MIFVVYVEAQVQTQRRTSDRPMPAARAGNAPGLPGGAIFIALCAVMVVAGFFLQYKLFPNGLIGGGAKANEAVAEIASTRGVRINEIMASNKRALVDAYGVCADWVELINDGQAAVDISGWSLMDKQSRATYFTFPQMALEPGECVLVFASGALRNAAGEEFHAPFKLSSAGDTLMLFDGGGALVQSMNIPALKADQSYAYVDGGWIQTGEYTPMAANTSENHASFVDVAPSTDRSIYINEVMADNLKTLKSADGAAYDWVELYNASGEAVDLTGYYLSDSADKPRRWKLPECSIEAGGYLIIYCSGKNGLFNGEVHASFKLGAEGEDVLLYDAAGALVDYVEYDNLRRDASLARQADGTYATSQTPTPGKAN